MIINRERERDREINSHLDARGVLSVELPHARVLGSVGLGASSAGLGGDPECSNVCAHDKLWA